MGVQTADTPLLIKEVKGGNMPNCRVIVPCRHVRWAVYRTNRSAFPLACRFARTTSSGVKSSGGSNSALVAPRLPPAWRDTNTKPTGLGDAPVQSFTALVSRALLWLTETSVGSFRRNKYQLKRGFFIPRVCTDAARNCCDPERAGRADAACRLRRIQRPTRNRHS